MSKKQSTLFVDGGLSTAPANQDFVVDGEFAYLAVNMVAQTGTDIQFVVTELFEDGFDLDYDGETANFTVGAVLSCDEQPNFKAVIIAITDNGTDGTLHLKKVQGHVSDNMNITDDAGGAAVVNGVLQRRFGEGSDWVSTGAIAATGQTMHRFVSPDLAAGDGDRGRVVPRWFRLKTTFNTITDAAYAVDLVQSTWGN